MSFMSKNANYDMDAAKHELDQKRLILDVKVETQVVLQLLVEKGIVTREEVNAMRNKVKNSPNYKVLYENLDDIESKISYFQNNPEDHLKELLKRKMDGTLK